MSGRFHKNSIIGGILLLMILFYFIFDPEGSILFPKCVVRSTTGLLCPGCGIQRAIHAMLHLDFASAMRHNALFTILTPYLIVGVVMELSPPLKARYDSLYQKLFSRNILYAVIIAIILFTIVRNL